MNFKNFGPIVCGMSKNHKDITPPLWTDLVKISSRKLRHTSSLSLECTDFKNVIFENIHWAHSEDAEVAEVKRPRNPKCQKF